MSFYTEEKAQGSAEYLLLFGGIIIIAVAALLIYRTYFSGSSGLKASADINNVRGSMNISNGSNPNPNSP